MKMWGARHDIASHHSSIHPYANGIDIMKNNPDQIAKILGELLARLSPVATAKSNTEKQNENIDRHKAAF